MNQKPPSCRGCPAYSTGRGFVPPLLPERPARFAFVGQGPGEQEAIFSRPFYPHAPSGGMLHTWIAEAPMDLREVALGNIVQCWLPQTLISGGLGRKSREPTAAEANHCYKAHVQPWLDSLPSNCHLVSVGAAATRFLLGKTGAVEHLNGVTHFQELPAAREEPLP